MILTVKPHSAILPIHTENPDAFRHLNVGGYSDLIPDGFTQSGIYVVK